MALASVRRWQGKTVGIRVTARDRELFAWINGHGFVTVAQIARWMDVHYQTAQRRVQRLVKHGYLQTAWVLHGEPRAIWPTKKGWRETKDELQPIRQASPGAFLHDRMLVDISLEALGRNPNLRFIPARRLRRRQWEKHPLLGAGHVADGLLVGPDGAKIVIELELTAKNEDVLKKIIQGHAADMGVEEVWYLVTDPAVRRLVTRLTKGYQPGLFRVLNWRESTA